MTTIRELRIKAVLSQRELAKKAGIAYATLCRIEKGKQRPYPATIRKIAKVLKSPPDQITFEP